MLPVVSGEFRVVADPDLRFAPSGMAVCSMRVVANSRKKNEKDEWVDDKVCWLKATAFKRVAENMAESFEKGSLVLITGRLQTEDWETREGEKRQSYVVIVDTIGPSLAFKPAKVMDVERAAAPSGGQGGAPAEDPWASPGGQADEPPF